MHEHTKIVPGFVTSLVKDPTWVWDIESEFSEKLYEDSMNFEKKSYSWKNILFDVKARNIFRMTQPKTKSTKEEWLEELYNILSRLILDLKKNKILSRLLIYSYGKKLLKLRKWSLGLLLKQSNKVSISPSFYGRLFHMTVMRKAFFVLTF